MICVHTFQACSCAAIACAGQYHKLWNLRDELPDWHYDETLLFFVVFVIGLLLVIILFFSFLCNLDQKCGSQKGWLSFVSNLRINSMRGMLLKRGMGNEVFDVN